MSRIFLSLILLLPHTVLAASDCHVVEYQDYYEVICLGNENPVSDPEPPDSKSTLPAEKVKTDTADSPRLGRISRSRLEAAIKTRNKLIQSERQKGNF